MHGSGLLPVLSQRIGAAGQEVPTHSLSNLIPVLLRYLLVQTQNLIMDSGRRWYLGVHPRYPANSHLTVPPRTTHILCE